MIINFLIKLFCLHAWEYDEPNKKNCRKCDKEEGLEEKV